VRAKAVGAFHEAASIANLTLDLRDTEEKNQRVSETLGVAQEAVGVALRALYL
jgi:hypothetical protein